MKAYLINPEQLSIEEIDYLGSSDEIYELLDATFFDVIRINEAGDVVYIDDEGLYTKEYYWTYGDYLHPIAGNGLLLGTDITTGETIEPQVIDRSDLMTNVRFISYETALAMAKAADAKAEKQREEYEKRGTNFIHLSAADILESTKYTDKSD